VKKVAGGSTTIYHYDLDGKLIAESTSTGTFTKEYLYMGVVRVAMVDVAGGNTLYHYLNDRLGTPEILTNSSGTVAWEVWYEPFGEAHIHPSSSVVNNIRLPGQYYDAETGLHYNYHRYYDPRTGRYLTPDPIGQAGGINLYPYAKGNPVNSIDPLGLYRSPDYLLYTVPGQSLFDYGMTSIENRDYAQGALYFAGMVGEQILVALTLGESLVARGAVCESNLASSGSRLLPPLRQQYTDAVESLAHRVPAMRQAGMSSEQIARILHAERRALGEQFKSLTPPDKLAEIYERNLQQYGDKLGPSIEWLRNKANKSWEQILESATRPGGKDLGF
jgi:RHS repeat-associated protein